jgi:beta-fructofuranosidase
MALSYTSADLESWEYEGIALQRSTEEREPVWMGALWECPQIFEVDGRDLMVSSVWDDDVLHYAGYAAGTYREGQFRADSWGRLTFGPSYYAPSFFRDADGRPCLTFWMRGIDDAESGWASAHSVPHVLAFQEEHLVAAPHPDLEKYRSPAVGTGELPGHAGDIVWSPSPGDSLSVTSGGQHVFVLSADAHSISAKTESEAFEVPYLGGDVRIILDAQAVEISSRGGVLGFAATPEGQTYCVEAANVTVYPLAHQ